MISSPTLSPLDQRLQLPNRRYIFAIYALTLSMYTVASPDPDSREGGQLPDPNECNSTLTSATREETLTPNPNECNCTLTSGTSVRRNLSPGKNSKLRVAAICDISCVSLG